MKRCVLESFCVSTVPVEVTSNGPPSSIASRAECLRTRGNLEGLIDVIESLPSSEIEREVTVPNSFYSTTTASLEYTTAVFVVCIFRGASINYNSGYRVSVSRRVVRLTCFWI